METNKSEHWERVYETKQPEEVSWTQLKPHTSLELINSLSLPSGASIIDIGGGDSRLVDFLLEEGYQNITVLDISKKALERAKKRLGEKSALVKWIHSDITEFNPDQKYDLWHDRATFHFLTKESDIAIYKKLVAGSVAANMILATFSDKGPDKCSGLEIKKYSTDELYNQFNTDFETLSCSNEDHTTPFGTTQNFSFCVFKKK